MKKIFQFLLLAVLTSLVLGQLTRITLTPQLAFYFHDILILLFLFIFIFYQLFYFLAHRHFNFFSPTFPFSSLLTRFKSLPKRQRQALFFLSFGLLFLLLASAATSFISFLYALRFFAYLLFLFTVSALSLFSKQEWQKIWFTFFLSFAACGLLQYFFLPDTRFLENLGWDDHYYRLIGTWFDPAFTALCLAFGLLYTFFISSLKKIPTWFLILNYLFLSLALVFTYSRSAFLALFLLTIFYLIQRISLQQKHFFSLFKKTIINKQAAKKTLFLVSLISFFLFVFFALSAHFYPSDSTNLLRTNSISLRWQTFQTQIKTFSLRTWIIGDGFFVPRPTAKISLNSSVAAQNIAQNIVDAKKTTPFPDNFFLLLISFFGLPITLLLTIFIFRTLRFYWRNSSPFFYFFLALLFVAQFNQTVFQPFVLLTFGLLLSSGIFTLFKPKNNC